MCVSCDLCECVVDQCAYVHVGVTTSLQVLEGETVPMADVFISISGGELKASNLTTEEGTVVYNDVVGG